MLSMITRGLTELRNHYGTGHDKHRPSLTSTIFFAGVHLLRSWKDARSLRSLTPKAPIKEDVFE
jgi:hypothetical protein